MQVCLEDPRGRMFAEVADTAVQVSIRDGDGLQVFVPSDDWMFYLTRDGVGGMPIWRPQQTEWRDGSDRMATE